MKNLTIQSDGKKILINLKEDKLVFTSKKESVAVLLTDISKIYIGHRKNKYKPDLFFISYTVISTVVGIGILYFLFKNEEHFNVWQTGMIFIVIASFAILLMIIAANRKPSLFVIYGNKTLEIPLDNRNEINSLKDFFENSGINVSHPKQD